MVDLNAQSQRATWIRQRITSLSFEKSATHLGSCLSTVEILEAILSTANISPDTVNSPDRDRIIVSKGHAAMAYYVALCAHDLLDEALLDTYMAQGSALWGHITRIAAVPAIDYSTGSLGHGIGLACGHAYGYRLKKNPARIFCLMSDGECNEGSVWESAQFASHQGLKNLTCLIDANKLQGFDYCENVLGDGNLVERFASFGWDSVAIDGHDLNALNTALNTASDRPRMIVCNTVKAKGLPAIENTIACHYKPATEDNVRTVKEAPCATN